MVAVCATAQEMGYYDLANLTIKSSSLNSFHLCKWRLHLARNKLNSYTVKASPYRGNQ